MEEDGDNGAGALRGEALVEACKAALKRRDVGGAGREDMDGDGGGHGEVCLCVCVLVRYVCGKVCEIERTKVTDA